MVITTIMSLMSKSHRYTYTNTSNKYDTNSDDGNINHYHGPLQRRSATAAS